MHQFSVSADFGNLAVLHYYDTVSVLGGGNPLGHNELGAGKIQVLKIVLNKFFCFHVYSRSGVIQNEDGGLDSQCAG